MSLYVTTVNSRRLLKITVVCSAVSAMVVLALFGYVLFTNARVEWPGYGRAMRNVSPKFAFVVFGILWPLVILGDVFVRRLKRRLLPSRDGYPIWLLIAAASVLLAYSSFQIYPVVRVRAELLAMREADQRHRGLKAGIDLSNQEGADEKNLRMLERIISELGWPERTSVGDKAASAAFLVLQHSDLGFQKKYLPLVRAAALKGEMSLSSLALLEDRVRVSDGGKQLFGSQLTTNLAGEWEPLPIEDEQHVSARRAAAGMEPLSDYLQDFARRRGGVVNSKWLDKRP
jgi:hypothetical protein